MDGRFLLDTNIVIRLFAGDKAILNWLKKKPEVFIPSIVLGELFYGAQKSAHIASNTLKIAELASNSEVLPCDSETAKYYGEIKNHLKKKGRPIPENDIWIGAIAKQHNLSLVTGDIHFKEIDGLATTQTF